jgi:hypothetical protein
MQDNPPTQDINSVVQEFPKGATSSAETVDSMETRSTNGPTLVATGATLAIGSYGLGLIFQEGFNVAGAAFIMYIAVPIGTLIFLYGCIKTMLFFNFLTYAKKLFFVLTIVTSIIALFGIVAYLRSSATEAEFSPREKQCAQQFGPNLTDEQYLAYKTCLSE